MILKVAVSLLIFSLVEDISTGGADCIPNLKNLAVYEGDSNMLMNLSGDPNTIKWTTIPTSDESSTYTISNNGNRDASLTGLYSLNQSGLVILKAATTQNPGPISTSGIYLAQCANNTNRTGAKLLVVRAAPYCSCNVSSPKAVQLTCSIVYADGTIHPINANMTWKIGDAVYATVTPQRKRINYYVFQSTSTITVDISVRSSVTCIVTFNQPTDISFKFIATNAPEFSANCSVEVCAPTTTALPTTTRPTPPQWTTTIRLLTTESPTTNSGDCLPTLKNLAAYEGDLNTVLNETVNARLRRWTVVPTSDEFGTYIIRDYNGFRDSTLSKLFYLNQTSLTILNATTTPPAVDSISTAGVYIAQCQNNSNMTAAKFVVVREAPDCSCNASLPDAVQLSCSVIYADGTLHPIKASMTWKLDGDFYTAETPERMRIDYYVFQSTSKITVDSSVRKRFTCIVTFNVPTEIQYDFIAMNAPEFNASCTVDVCPYETTSSEATTSLPPQTTTAWLPTTESTTAIPSYCFPNLKNLAVYEGQSNTIMNLTADTRNVKWTSVPTSDEIGSYTIQDYGGYRTPSLTGLFYPNQSGLVILEASSTDYDAPISTSGIYIAQCANRNRTAAKLLVVRGAPECSCNAISPTDVQLSCSIVYADGTVHPINAAMTWKTGDYVYPTETPERTRFDYYVFESTSTIAVNGSVPETYTCTVTYNAPTNIEYDFIATNAPEFSASCSVEVCSFSTATTPPQTGTSPPPTTRRTTTTPSNCSPNMKNIAVYEGDKNTIMNVTADPNVIKWTTSPTSDEYGSYTIQDYGGYRYPSLAGLFYPNQSGLVILNATTTESGGPISTSALYIAQCSGSRNRYGAKLVVVRAAPDCSCNTSSPTEVQLFCSIIYADGTVNPINAAMSWTFNGGDYTKETPTRERFDYYVYQSTSMLTVKRSDVENYKCTVTFDTPTEIFYDFIATNAPEFNASCSATVCDITSSTSIITPPASTYTTPTAVISPLTTSSGIASTFPPSTPLISQQLTTNPSNSTSGSCVSSMRNVAVREGELDVWMNVTSSSCVTWTVYSTSDELVEYTITGPGCTVGPTELYDANQNGLMIRNSTITPNGTLMSTAGIYVAQCGNNGSIAAAKLLVVQSGPECSCVNDSSSAGVQLNCTVHFADNTNHPIPAIITWLINGKYEQPEAPYRNRTDYFVYTATSSITYPGFVRDYQCILTFGEPADIGYDFVATNAPEFNANCSTPCQYITSR